MSYFFSHDKYDCMISHKYWPTYTGDWDCINVRASSNLYTYWCRNHIHRIMCLPFRLGGLSSYYRCSPYLQEEKNMQINMFSLVRKSVKKEKQRWGVGSIMWVCLNKRLSNLGQWKWKAWQRSKPSVCNQESWIKWNYTITCWPTPTLTLRHTVHFQHAVYKCM